MPEQELEKVKFYKIEKGMINFDNLLLFIFVFSVLNVLKISTVFITSLLQTLPKKMELSSRETILFHLTLTYFITYITLLI